MALRPVSLMGANAPQSLDIATEQARLQMAQQLALQLIQQSYEREPASIPGPTNNPFAISVPNMAPIGRAFARHFAAQQLGETQDQQAKLAQLVNTMTQKELEQVQKIRSGYTEEEPAVMRPAPELGGGPGAPVTTPGDPRAAANYAMQSSLPRVQKFGEEMFKGQLTEKEAAELAAKNEPGSVAGALATGNIAGIKPQQWELLPQEDGKPLMKRNVQTGDVQQVSSPYGNQTPESFWEKELGPVVFKGLDQERVKYLENGEMAKNIVNARNAALATPASKFGAAPEVRQLYNKVLSLMGSETRVTESNFDNVIGEANKMMAKFVRALAPVAGADVAIALTSTASPAQTQPAFLKALDIMGNNIGSAMNTHENQVRRLRSSIPAAKQDLFENYYIPQIQFRPTEFEAAPGSPAATGQPGIPSSEAERKAARNKKRAELGLGPEQ